MSKQLLTAARLAALTGILAVAYVPTMAWAAKQTEGPASSQAAAVEDTATSFTAQDAWTSRTKAVLSEVAPGVWIHRSWFRFPNGDTYFSNGLVVKSFDDNTVTLVDTAWGTESTQNLLKQIEAELGLQVANAIVTHWHADKTAGVDILKSHGIPVYATPETIALCRENDKPVPDHPIVGLEDPGSTTTVAGVEVMYPGPGHASDNILVWEPRNRVLLGGCAVRAATDNSPGNLSDADLKQWPASMRRAEAAYGQAAKIVIPGHGEPAGPELLEHTAKIAEKFDKIRSESTPSDG